MSRNLPWYLGLVGEQHWLCRLICLLAAVLSAVSVLGVLGMGGRNRRLTANQPRASLSLQLSAPSKGNKKENVLVSEGAHPESGILWVDSLNPPGLCVGAALMPGWTCRDSLGGQALAA